MNLFIFFALPLATILLAIVFQKILRSPILVAITFFAIYLIVAFVEFSDTLAEAIIAAIIYTIIAYITAYIVMIICRLRRRFCHCRREEAENNRRCGCGNSDRSSDLLTIDSTCMANDTNNLTDETATLCNSNVATSRQYVSRPVAYGNRSCYRRN